VKAIVGLAVNELIGPIEFGRRVDRNTGHSSPFALLDNSPDALEKMTAAA
jgi:hypothetical protein